jgi:hypothetical protein
MCKECNLIIYLDKYTPVGRRLVRWPNCCGRIDLLSRRTGLHVEDVDDNPRGKYA